MHGVKLALRRLVVDDRDAAGLRAARFHAGEGRGIVGAVNARRDDHDALDVQALMQRRHLLGQRHLRCINPPGKEREFLRLTENVRVTIACPCGHVEIHRRRQLRRLRQYPSCSHGNSGRDRAEHYCASCWHGFPPADACLESGVWTSLKGRSGSLVEQTSMALWDRAEGEFKALIRSDVAGRRSSPAGCPRQPRHTLSPHRPR